MPADRTCPDCLRTLPLSSYYVYSRDNRPYKRCKACSNRRRRPFVTRPRRVVLIGPACQEPGVDPEIFFAVQPSIDLLDAPMSKQELDRENKRRVREAKAVCARCPVRLACLWGHIDEPFGFFGGHTAQGRYRLKVRPGIVRSDDCA